MTPLQSESLARAESPSPEAAPTGEPVEFARILDEYFSSLEKGVPLDRHELLRKYPQFDHVLRPYLDSLELLHQAALGIRRESQEAAGNAPLSDQAIAPLGTLGEFRLLRELGRGGMGIVYEAEQRSLSRRVALKVLPFAGALQPRSLQRFRNEALAAAQLDHPHIVHIISVGQDRGIHFYSMQLVDGLSLSQVIRQLRNSDRVAEISPDFSASLEAVGEDDTQNDESTLSGIASTFPARHSFEYYQVVVRLGIEAAEAIHHAHEQGIVHRDIKPSNLLLDTHGKLWVTDFGLARVRSELSHLTGTGDMLGTLSYMSPEQIEGPPAQVDSRTDVYSLGVTLYELLTLRQPFGRGQQQMSVRHRDLDEPPPLRRFIPTVPRELETIVLKAMATDPSRRYPSAAALAEDLRRYLEHKPIQAVRPGLWWRMQKWGRRNRTGIIAATITAVATLLVATVGLWHEWKVARRHHAEAERAALEAQQHVHAADLASAQRAWKEGNTAVALQLLDRQVPRPGQTDLRKFAWHHLRHIMTNSARTFVGHNGEVYFVTFSPDGRHLASASADRSARVWDVASGEVRQILRHDDEVNWVDFSPDGFWIATASDDRTVKVWNAATGERIALLQAHTDPVVGAIFNAYATQLITFSRQSEIKVWDTSSWTEISSFVASAGKLQTLALSPNENTLVTGDEHRGIEVFEFPSGRPIASLKKHHLMVRSVGFSSDGSLMASASDDGWLYLWDTQTWQERGALNVGETQSVRFAPRSNWFVRGGGDYTVELWDYERKERMTVFRGHVRHVWGVAVSPDGRQVASCGADQTVRLWPVPGVDEQFGQIAYLPSVDSVAMDVEHDKFAVVQQHDTDQLRDLRTGELIADLPNLGENHHSHMQFSHDGSTLSVSNWDGSSRVWDIRQGMVEARCNIEDALANHGLALSPTGSVLATTSDMASNHFRVYLWDTQTGDLRAELSGYKQHVQVGAISHGSSSRASSAGPELLLAVGDWSGEIYVHDLATTALRYRFTSSVLIPSAITFSPDDKLLAVGGDMGIEIRDARTGELKQRLLGHHRPLCALAFCPTEATLASAAHDGTVRLWDLATGRELLSFGVPQKSRCQLAFNRTGTELFAACVAPNYDLRIFRWSAPRAEYHAPSSLTGMQPPTPSVVPR